MLAMKKHFGVICTGFEGVGNDIGAIGHGGSGMPGSHKWWGFGCPCIPLLRFGVVKLGDQKSSGSQEDP